MAQGLNQYSRTVAANSEEKVHVSGNFVYIQNGGPLVVRIRAGETSAEADTSEFDMTKGDSLKLPFTQVDLVNNTASAMEVTIIAGKGEFDRPGTIGAAVNFDPNGAGAVTVPSGSFTQVVAQDNSRQAILIQSDPSSRPPNTANLGGGVGLSDGATGQSAIAAGTSLFPGDIVVIETTDEVWAGSSQLGQLIGFAELKN